MPFITVVISQNFPHYCSFPADYSGNISVAALCTVQLCSFVWFLLFPDTVRVHRFLFLHTFFNRLAAIQLNRSIQYSQSMSQPDDAKKVAVAGWDRQTDA